jgi:uncharacterized protein YbaR (Trm112 family)
LLCRNGALVFPVVEGVPMMVIELAKKATNHEKSL